MVAPQIALATENEVSEAVAARLVKGIAPGLEIGLRFRRGAFGYLRSRLGSFYQISRRQTVLLITDLDTSVCPAALIAEWCRRVTRNDGLLFRVAVREIEFWLFPDHEAMRSLLGARSGRLPENPDELPDPKGTLLGLARSAPRPIRANLLPEPGSISAQGLGYNRVLIEWVHRNWSPSRASSRSDSLRRTCGRLRQLATTHAR